MAKASSKKKKSEPGTRSYARDAKESRKAAEGGPARGFEHDHKEATADMDISFGEAPFGETENESERITGQGTDERIQRTGHTYRNEEPDKFDDPSLSEGSPTERSRGGNGEVYPGDPDIGLHIPQDLRFGKEDISGVSEWSMRATKPELDNGLDAGDFQRGDHEIRDESEQTLISRLEKVPDDLDLDVRAAVVTVRGTVPTKEIQNKIEDVLIDVPGVKEVKNFLVVRS